MDNKVRHAVERCCLLINLVVALNRAFLSPSGPTPPREPPTNTRVLIPGTFTHNKPVDPG